MLESDKRTEISSCFMEYIGLLLCALTIYMCVCVCVRMYFAFGLFPLTTGGAQ